LLKKRGFCQFPVVKDGKLDVDEVLRMIRMCSEKVLLVSSFEKADYTFYCWLIGCDFEELDRRLKKEKLNADLTYSGGS